MSSSDLAPPTVQPCPGCQAPVRALPVEGLGVVTVEGATLNLVHPRTGEVRLAMVPHACPSPPDSGRCRDRSGGALGCGAPMVWPDEGGSRIPLDPTLILALDAHGRPWAGRVSHFATCPNASSHRRRQARSG